MQERRRTIVTYRLSSLAAQAVEERVGGVGPLCSASLQLAADALLFDQSSLPVRFHSPLADRHHQVGDRPLEELTESLRRLSLLETLREDFGDSR